jgi:hypothetical protein
VNGGRAREKNKECISALLHVGRIRPCALVWDERHGRRY